MSLSNNFPTIRPELNLNFINATSLDPRITFTRSLDTATYFDNEGLLRTALANTPRFDYDPNTLAPRGLLIEGARTNLILYSRDMTQAEWVKTDVTPTRNQVGIDGVANTATLLTEGSAGTALVQQSGAAVAAGATITGSVVLKRGNTDWVRVVVADTTLADGANAWFNLNTGSKGQVTARGAGSNNSSTITPLGGGWYRCTVTSTPNGTYTTPQIGIVSASADGSSTRVSGATYIVDCAQLEVGAFATSIINTTTTTVTRSNDDATMTGTKFSSWFNQTEGTFVAETFGVASVANRNAGIYSLPGVPTTNLFFNFGKLRLTNGTNNIDITTSDAVASAVFKCSSAYQSGTGGAVSVNGAVPVVNALYTLSSTSELYIGNGAGSYINGCVRRLSYYPARLSNSQLQALTLL